MVKEAQTFRFREEPFTHSYHPVQWNERKTMYSQGNEEKEVLTSIDTIIRLSEPYTRPYDQISELSAMKVFFWWSLTVMMMVQL